jgi:excisionase family DNA binding protein
MDEHVSRADIDMGIMIVHDVAHYLRLSEAKIYQMAQEGIVPAIRIGKSWRFKRELIDDWIRRKTEVSLNAE